VLRRGAEPASVYRSGEEATELPLIQEEIAGLARGRTVIVDAGALRRGAGHR